MDLSPRKPNLADIMGVCSIKAIFSYYIGQLIAFATILEALIVTAPSLQLAYRIVRRQNLVFLSFPIKWRWIREN